MDPISHAASGAILALSLPERPASRFFVPMAALVTALPDIDVIFAPAPIDFLLLHRGITHSLAAIPFMALIVSLFFFPFWRNSTPNSWSYLRTYFYICTLFLLHIWLDIITTYGTMVFLPFSDYRVRLNGIFIIDLLITLPMLLTVFLARKKRKLACLVLIWIFIYPSACVGLRMWHEARASERLSAENITNIAVLPDALAPFYWRVIYQSETPFDPDNTEQNLTTLPKAIQGYVYPNTAQSIHHQGLDMFGNPRTKVLNYPALRPEIAESISVTSRRALAYLDFSLMPLEASRPIGSGEEFIIYDLRFGTMLPWVKSIMDLRNDGAPPFLFKAQREGEAWTKIRLVFGGSGKDSQWQKPQTPEPATFWQWLVGLY